MSSNSTSDVFIHDSSYVDENVKIGSGTRIWHFSHVLSNAVIGKNCNLGQNVCISGGVTIGNNVKIQNNVSVYEGTLIEDDVFLGPSCVLTNVSNPRSQVNRKKLYEKTHIRKGATIGANATIVCNVTIGRYAFICAGAVVTSDVPDYTVVKGVPGRHEGWVSRHGIPLGTPDDRGIYKCPESKLTYKENQAGQLFCIDLDEDTDLPEHLSVGQKNYREIKPKKESM